MEPVLVSPLLEPDADGVIGSVSPDDALNARRRRDRLTEDVADKPGNTERLRLRSRSTRTRDTDVTSSCSPRLSASPSTTSHAALTPVASSNRAAINTVSSTGSSNETKTASSIWRHRVLIGRRETS